MATTSWRFNATDFIPGINVQQGVQLGNYYPRVEFSGPIVEGEAVVFAVVRRAAHVGVMKGLPAGEPDQARSGQGTVCRGCCGRCRRGTACMWVFCTNVDSAGNLGLDALHPESTTTGQRQRRNVWVGEGQS